MTLHACTVRSTVMLDLYDMLGDDCLMVKIIGVKRTSDLTVAIDWRISQPTTSDTGYDDIHIPNGRAYT